MKKKNNVGGAALGLVILLGLAKGIKKTHCLTGNVGYILPFLDLQHSRKLVGIAVCIKSSVINEMGPFFLNLLRQER